MNYLAVGGIGSNIEVPQNAFEKRNAKDIDLLILDDFEEKQGEEKEDECSISLKITVILYRNSYLMESSIFELIKFMTCFFKFSLSIGIRLKDN